MTAMAVEVKKLDLQTGDVVEIDVLLTARARAEAPRHGERR